MHLSQQKSLARPSKILRRYFIHSTQTSSSNGWRIIGLAANLLYSSKNDHLNINDKSFEFLLAHSISSTHSLQSLLFPILLPNLQLSNLKPVSLNILTLFHSTDQKEFLRLCLILIFQQIVTLMPERKMWNENEDRILRFLKEEQGERKWSVIARKMQSDFGIPGRTGKQCRERYHNHLDQSISTSSWSKSQEQTLLRMHDEVGNKWSIIAQKLAGRSDNCVKNHFYSKLRKAVRKLNKLITDNFKKNYKEIKISSIYKILEICQTSFKNSSKYDEDMIERCQVLKKQLYLLDSCTNHSETEELDLCQHQRIIVELNQFENKQKRSTKSTKPHKYSTSTIQTTRNKQQTADVKKQGSQESLYWVLKKVCQEYMLKQG